MNTGKSIFTLLLVLLAVLPGFAEESAEGKRAFEQETLFKAGKVEHGGFGGPVVKISSVKNVGRVLVGGRGAWLINHSLTLGGGGYGVATEMSGNVNGTNRRFHMGYGGFEIGYIFRPASLIHVRIVNLIGAGGAGYRRGGDDCDGCRFPRFNADSFFVLEPSLYLELNIIKWMRMSLGAGYRYVNGLDGVPDYPDKDLCGASVELSFSFGKF